MRQRLSAMHLTKELCALYIIFIYLATVESNFRRLIFMYYIMYEVDSHQPSYMYVIFHYDDMN